MDAIQEVVRVHLPGFGIIVHSTNNVWIWIAGNRIHSDVFRIIILKFCHFRTDTSKPLLSQRVQAEGFAITDHIFFAKLKILMSCLRISRIYVIPLTVKLDFFNK